MLQLGARPNLTEQSTLRIENRSPQIARTMIPPRSPRVRSSLRWDKSGRHLGSRPLREGQNPLDLASQLLWAAEVNRPLELGKLCEANPKKKPRRRRGCRQVVANPSECEGRQTNPLPRQVPYVLRRTKKKPRSKV